MNLTTNKIKKAVEFADGFSISLKTIQFGDCFYYSLNSFNVESGLSTGFYDLFLDRVIHGINRECNFDIQTFDTCIVLFNIPDAIIEHDGTTEGIREAREKAIIFVLDNS